MRSGCDGPTYGKRDGPVRDTGKARRVDCGACSIIRANDGAQSGFAASRKSVGRAPEVGDAAARQGDWRLEVLLIARIVVLALVSLMVGPAGLSPRAGRASGSQA